MTALLALLPPHFHPLFRALLVNAGVHPHPVTHRPTLVFVTYGRGKLANLRARPQLAATFRNGWRWATVEGRAELAGPMVRSHGSPTRTNCGCCCGTSSPPRVARTTIGMNTTG